MRRFPVPIPYSFDMDVLGCHSLIDLILEDRIPKRTRLHAISKLLKRVVYTGKSPLPSASPIETPPDWLKDLGDPFDQSL